MPFQFSSAWPLSVLFVSVMSSKPVVSVSLLLTPASSAELHIQIFTCPLNLRVPEHLRFNKFKTGSLSFSINLPCPTRSTTSQQARNPDMIPNTSSPLPALLAPHLLPFSSAPLHPSLSSCFRPPVMQPFCHCFLSPPRPHLSIPLPLAPRWITTHFADLH